MKSHIRSWCGGALAASFAAALALAGCGCPAPPRPPSTSLLEPGGSFPPRALLNHVYAVLDADTLHAIETSAYLKDTFAGVKTHTTHADGRSWTGVYLTGHHTYLELFSPSPTDFVGKLGAGLGVETKGGVLSFADSMLRTAGTYRMARHTVTRPKGAIPWFVSGAAITEEEESTVPLELWVMEYMPEFTRSVLGTPRIDREAYNAKGYHPELLFEDVTSAEMAIPMAAFPRVTAQLSGFGWSVEVQDGAGAAGRGFVARGPEGVTLVVHQAPQPFLRALSFRLRRPVSPATKESIGTSVLETGPGDVARWVFARPDVAPPA